MDNFNFVVLKKLTRSAVNIDNLLRILGKTGRISKNVADQLNSEYLIVEIDTESKAVRLTPTGDSRKGYKFRIDKFGRACGNNASLFRKIPKGDYIKVRGTVATFVKEEDNNG